MKKLFLLLVAAVLLAGCLKDDYKGSYVTLSENILGKWMVADKDGQPAPTNEKAVFDFVSTTKAYLSASLNAHPGESAWVNQVEAAVDIQGDRLTITYQPVPGAVSVQEYTVTGITAHELTADARITLTHDDGSVIVHNGSVRFVKVDADYSTRILGLWEGCMISDESEFDDGQEHRWEYKEDGTFDFYLKDNKGIWQKKEDEYGEYFVAGNLLCTRWKNAGAAEENYEWWEITAMGNKGMVWTALRRKANGSTYTAAFSMNKVNVPTQAEVESAIVGKWMNAEINGNAALTNDKGVYTFVSTTKAYMSASLSDRLDGGDVWVYHDVLDVNIQGNVVTLIHELDAHQTVTTRMIVASIDADAMEASVENTLTVDGAVKGVVNDYIRYERIKERYDASIIGLWEGRMTSEKSAYGDDEYHRWEYKDDGTYVYYLQNGSGRWEISDDEYSIYFVDGRLLCTCWSEAGEDHREWWEIRSLNGSTMIWTALRQDEMGETYVASFSMNRVKVPSQSEVEQHIKGKWMSETIDGDPVPTDEKAVFTFLSKTQAAMSASFDNIPGETADVWVFQREYDVTIKGNVVTLTHEVDAHTTMQDVMIIGAIDDQGIDCMFQHTEYYDGRETASYSMVNLHLAKVKTPVRYASAILGTWEGRVATDYSKYDDGDMHRWEYDGSSYVYYMKQGDNWVPSSNSRNEYFVDGNLLCTRWLDNGVEYRECWEIVSIENGLMVWTALRRDDDGSTYTAAFSMWKVK